nr:SpaA isopeptide-forming pilin-related protein [Raoultibacter massiliensis]
MAAPYPYVLGEPREFDVSYRSDDVKIVDPVDLGSYVNERFAATLNILKTDVDGAPLAKAEFELRDPSGAVVKGGIVTGSDGRASVAGIDEGSYVLVETKAPEGYQLDQTPHEIEAVYDQAGQTIEITLVNLAEPIPRIPDVTNPPTTPHPADSPKMPTPVGGLARTGDGYLAAGIGAFAALAVVAAAAAGALALRRRRSAGE